MHADLAELYSIGINRSLQKAETLEHRYFSSNVNDIETKAQTFRHRSFLSEQNQNVLLWSAYYRNESRTFQSVPKRKLPIIKDFGLTLLIYTLVLVQRLAVQSLKALDFGKYGPLVDFFHGIKLHQPVESR
jgi:hypothetical protein